MRLRNLVAGVGALCLASACGQHPGETSLLALGDEPAGSNCTTGGKKVEIGLDKNWDGVLDGAEVSQTSFICNGAIGDTGQTGSSCSVTDNQDGTKTIQCGPNNAVTVSDGAKGDTGASCSVVNNGNGTVTITCGASSVTVAYGSGSAGHDSLVQMTPEAAGSNCAQGGQMIQTGLDADGNGSLGAGEVSATQYVCNGISGTNGTNGSNGYDSLVSITIEPAGANCNAGGQAIRSGVDTNRNGTLDAGEASAVRYVCNGVNGTNGTNGTNGNNGTNGTNGHNSLVSINDEPAGANCTNGGKRLQSGVDLNDNGTLDAGEATSTQYVCNGANGTNGSSGASIYGDGSDGASVVGTANWITSPPSGTLQFTSFNVTGTLTVPSGLIIRATGNVTISGSIVISTNPAAEKGIATTSAMSGTGTGGAAVAGAGGIGGMNTMLAKLMVNPGANGGGKGSGIIGRNAGAGGGTIVIVAGGTISINGSVLANGGVGVTDDAIDGGGGGGGGIIVMAARTSIANTGSISAQGGSGGASTTISAASGGGGGGIVNLIAPSITAGTVNVNGGAAGSSAITASTYAGGGGGGSAGNGGASGRPGVGASAGTAGYVFNNVVSDPSSLFTLSTRP